MTKQKIAVVGSGISGLSAAWLLSKKHQVTLFEAGSHIGGHANTVEMETAEGVIAVDTGFIVFNELNYPNLTRLFAHLNVPTNQTEMTFALSQDAGDYEYSGLGASGFFGQKSNIFNLQHWRLLQDILRFFKTVRANVHQYPENISLGDFLRAEDYSSSFVENHIVPMGAAIWSTDMQDMLDFPARSFVNFYANHGMLQIADRPLWRTVKGGSREYVSRLIEDGKFEIQKNNAVTKLVRRNGFAQICDARGTVRPFDQVVLATHADTALALIEEPTPLEQELLSLFPYQKNRAVLHRDPRFMPKRKKLWSSWNYLKKGERNTTKLCLTYWMNRLQNLPTKSNIFVTLNPHDEIHPKLAVQEFEYDHPVFHASGIAAQKKLWQLQGQNRTWFCGSYFGYGFHEDGIQSGLAVAEQLGNLKRPWEFDEKHARVFCNPVARVEAAE